MPKKSKKVSIVIPEDCPVLDLLDLYDAVALAAGRVPGSVNYDCRKLYVSTDIYNAYCEHMKRVEMEESIGAFWLIYGPKISENLMGGEVEILDGFFIES